MTRTDTCRECGREIAAGHPRKLDAQLCLECNHWTQLVALLSISYRGDREPIDPKSVVRYNGRHYLIVTEPIGHGAPRGHSGARFVVHFADGRKGRSRHASAIDSPTT
jgi:hypothetical protein